MATHMGAIVVSTALLTSGTLLLASSAMAGGFSGSCENLKLQFPTSGGVFLEADCKDETGNPNHSTINLNDYIANMNGDLVWLENGNFSATCDRPELAGIGSQSTNSATLVVMCRTGGYIPFQPNRFNLDERITNRNGTLVYEP